MLAGTELHDAEQARGKHVLVVGYGKSACDVTVPISEVAASTDVIARHLLWKVPRRIGGVVNFKLLLLTRMGEALFRYLRPRGVEKFLHGPANGARGRMINSIGSASVRQFGLGRLRLVPPGQMEDIVRGAIGLATEGFFEGVEDGCIVVHPDRTIARLLADGGAPAAELDDGTRLPADLVVCATGFTQGVPFLPADVTARLLDERGNFMLYRQIRPVDVPDLYFNGYNSSFFSPLNAEMAAVWIAADMAGAVAAARAAGDAAGRSPTSSRSWTTPPTPTTAAAGRSSRSRCTTSTRCSAISTSTSAQRSARRTGSCRSTRLGVPPDHFHGPRPPAACRLRRDSRDGGRTGTSSRPVARRVAPRLNHPASVSAPPGPHDRQHSSACPASYHQSFQPHSPQPNRSGRLK